jgi:hypothetical protein
VASSTIGDQATFSLDEDEGFEEDDPDVAAEMAALSPLSLAFLSAGLSELSLLEDDDSLDCLSFAAVAELEPFLLSVR